MAVPLKIALAQQDFPVGDVAGNVQRVVDAAACARDGLGCQLIVFPELTLTGYPPEDLLLRADFVAQAGQGLSDLTARLRGIDAIVGHLQHVDGRLYNAASLLRDGRIIGTHHKWHLPNYAVFDEKRYFTAGDGACVLSVAGVPVGITICEDIWEDGPVAAACQAGARLLVNLNASPYHMEQGDVRREIAARQAKRHGIPLVYVNLVGGQDELVFDGASFVVDAGGEVVRHFPAFAAGIHDVVFDSRPQVVPRPAPGPAPLSAEQGAYRALTLGVGDYVRKNGFAGALVGLSGGVDSALTLAVAVDALGAENVEAVLMPSRYTAAMSVADARAQADALGVQHRLIGIEGALAAFTQALAPVFQGAAPDTTEENLQARCRGVILMALSNKGGRIVLTTGNKSEMAVGYATLYGDMAGGFAVLKDVPKTLVYRLARERNARSPVIPSRVLTRPPSAELAPDQRDSDTLPPYEILDPILERYIEHDQPPAEIVAAGFDPAIVEQIVAMVDRNEYKRRQAPPGVRITQRAFGRDRRYPISSAFRPGRWSAPGLRKRG